MVGVRMGARNPANVAAEGLPQALGVLVVLGPRVDHAKAGAGLAHDVAVGARPRHKPRVGHGEAQHMRQQCHRRGVLPSLCCRALGYGAGGGFCGQAQRVCRCDHKLLYNASRKIANLA
jgi:hypothetical protein